MAGSITTVLFVWTIAVICSLLLPVEAVVQSIDEEMIQIDRCVYSSIVPVYEFGLGHSLFDFSDEQEVLNFEYLNNTYYFRLCGTGMPRPCRRASICKQTTSQQLQYERVTPLIATDIIREENGISIDYDMIAIVNATCINSTSPYVDVLDGSNDTTLSLDYYTQYACEGLSLQVRDVNIYLGSNNSEIMITFMPPNSTLSTDRLLLFRVFIDNSPIDSIIVHRNTADNQIIQYNVSANITELNLVFCNTYNISVGTIADYFNKGVYNVTTFNNQSYYLSHLELVESTTYSNFTSNQCLWNITLRIYSSYATYLSIWQITPNITISRTLIYPDSLPFDISINMIQINCNVLSNYSIFLREAVIDGITYQRLPCTANGTYYQSFPPNLTTSEEDDDDDGLSEKDKIIITAVVTFVGTLLLVCLLWLLCILLARRFKRPKKVYLYPLKKGKRNFNKIGKQKEGVLIP